MWYIEFEVKSDTEYDVGVEAFPQYIFVMPQLKN